MTAGGASSPAASEAISSRRAQYEAGAASTSVEVLIRRWCHDRAVR
jgi:hypothetical protein